jgi:methionyl-tRNA synthetase
LPVQSVLQRYLCKESPYGTELSFSEESLRTMHNADLCDTLGNLVHRATNLCDKFCAGTVPDVPPPPTCPIDFSSIRSTFMEKLSKFELDAGASLAMAAFRDVNGYLTLAAPWHLKGQEHEEQRQVIVRAVLESVYALAHLLIPYIPQGAEKIFEKLSTKPLPLIALEADLRNLIPGTKIHVGEVLYPKLISDEETREQKKNVDFAELQARKKMERERHQEASKAALDVAEGSDDQSDFTKLDIRVGQIVKAWYHEEADKLFCEEIDVGEQRPRQIASGLRNFYTLEEFQSMKVLVVCNLKASKIVGFTSNGMVLAAKSTDGSKVELIKPPDSSKAGERVFIKGLEGAPYSAAQVKKRKVMESVASKMKTGEGGIAYWDGNVIMTSEGVCAAASLVDAPIS